MCIFICIDLVDFILFGLVIFSIVFFDLIWVSCIFISFGLSLLACFYVLFLSYCCQYVSFLWVKFSIGGCSFAVLSVEMLARIIQLNLIIFWYFAYFQLCYACYDYFCIILTCSLVFFVGHQTINPSTIK